MECIICGKNLDYVMKNSFNSQINECKTCQIHSSDTNSLSSDVKKKYLNDFWEEEDIEEIVNSNFSNKVGKEKLDVAKSMYAFCKEYLKNKTDILEIGTGTEIGRAHV